MWKYLKYSKSSLIGYLIVSIIEGVIGAILGDIQGSKYENNRRYFKRC